MAEKKSEFVVTDRRRFGAEGETRPDAPAVEEEKAAAPPVVKQATPPAAAPPTGQSAQAPTGEAQAADGKEEELPAPPTAEEQHEQVKRIRFPPKKLTISFLPRARLARAPWR